MYVHVHDNNFLNRQCLFVLFQSITVWLLTQNERYLLSAEFVQFARCGPKMKTREPRRVLKAALQIHANGVLGVWPVERPSSLPSPGVSSSSLAGFSSTASTAMSPGINDKVQKIHLSSLKWLLPKNLSIFSLSLKTLLKILTFKFFFWKWLKIKHSWKKVFLSISCYGYICTYVCRWI